MLCLYLCVCACVCVCAYVYTQIFELASFAMEITTSCIKQRGNKSFQLELQLERKTWYANRHYYWGRTATPPCIRQNINVNACYICMASTPPPPSVCRHTHPSPLYSIYIFYLLEIEKPTMHSIEKWNWKVAHWFTACLARRRWGSRGGGVAGAVTVAVEQWG